MEHCPKAEQIVDMSLWPKQLGPGDLVSFLSSGVVSLVQSPDLCSHQAP
jgi:hypothetical protein